MAEVPTTAQQEHGPAIIRSIASITGDMLTRWLDVAYTNYICITKCNYSHTGEASITLIHEQLFKVLPSLDKHANNPSVMKKRINKRS